MTEVKNKAWINKQIEQHLLETEGEEYTGYEAGIEFVQLLIEETVVKLNEDQQVVLDWLKCDAFSRKTLNPVGSIGKLNKCDVTENVAQAFVGLTDSKQFEVLQAFAEWGLSNDK
ncbi:hypothetical protein AB6884_04585 [Carnobacterium maltaromaticum]|jgi:hypothetical protein|uniref:hypothetical protein n=1 Tax=Carnobacterium maltaromaticum TaxID=2751 RepID=UPI0039BE5FAC